MKRALVVVVALLALLVGMVWWLNLRGEDRIDASAVTSTPPSAELIARGAYLARAGNCMGCHTVQGGAAYAGGRGVPTPFGTVFAPNLTPDPATGIGQWSSAQFWRALHNGRSRDGRLLYPAFPYPNYSRITRADADALFTYLQSLPPVVQTNKAHTLSFPFDQQAALAVWRALYFRPGQHVDDPTRPAEWNRGAYLVEGLGHCNACHSSRNALGATSGALDLAGGLIPVQNWYAPSLRSPLEAGVADWSNAQIAALLKAGVATAPNGAMVSVSGPMSEVVLGSTQHLSDTDLSAMAAYLKALPQSDAPTAATKASTVAIVGPGAALYEKHCVQCHGEQGQGVPGIYPPLAGNRAVTMASTANLIHIVLEGGFAPATAGNSRPFGMPPFATLLSTDELAQVLSHIRSSWGNQAPAVSAVDVTLGREAR